MNLNLRRRPILRGVRLALLAGFGGLLALLVFLGIYAARSLNRVKTIDAQSSRAYVQRNDRLEAIRSFAYTASSRVRDYLIDPDPASARAHRENARRHWSQMEQAFSSYEAVAAEGRVALLAKLRAELASYWKIANLSLELDDEKRSQQSYPLLAGELGPLRDGFLATLDEIRTQDQADLRNEIRESAALIEVLQDHLWFVIAASFLVGSGLAWITWRYLFRLETEAQRRYKESVEAAAELEQLSHRLLSVQEDERRRLARELHDEVGQSVGALLVNLGQARTAYASPPDEVRERLESATQLGESTLRTVRNMCLLLRPSMLDDLGLIPALHWQARETSRRTGIDVQVHSEEGEDLELSEDVRTAIYRVVQEALQNVERHSEAKRAEILLRRESQGLKIVVRDDGKGFDPALTRGLGLLGMEERVSQFQGILRAESAPGKGTILSITLPAILPKEQPSHP
jgi:signal transduction histidine kinase